MRNKPAFLSILAVAFIIGGCGGSSTGGSSTTRGTGRLTISIKWPQHSSRLVPLQAQQIVVQVTGPNGVVTNPLVVGASDQNFIPEGTTSVTTVPLLAGNYTITASAYADPPPAAGTTSAPADQPLASAATASNSVSITPGSTPTQFLINMNSTVQRFDFHFDSHDGTPPSDTYVTPGGAPPAPVSIDPAAITTVSVSAQYAPTGSNPYYNLNLFQSGAATNLAVSNALLAQGYSVPNAVGTAGNQVVGNLIVPSSSQLGQSGTMTVTYSEPSSQTQTAAVPFTVASALPTITFSALTVDPSVASLSDVQPYQASSGEPFAFLAADATNSYATVNLNSTLSTTGTVIAANTAYTVLGMTAPVTGLNLNGSGYGAIGGSTTITPFGGDGSVSLTNNVTDMTTGFLTSSTVGSAPTLSSFLYTAANSTVAVLPSGPTITAAFPSATATAIAASPSLTLPQAVAAPEVLFYIDATGLHRVSFEGGSNSLDGTFSATAYTAVTTAGGCVFALKANGIDVYSLSGNLMESLTAPAKFPSGFTGQRLATLEYNGAIHITVVGLQTGVPAAYQS